MDVLRNTILRNYRPLILIALGLISYWLISLDMVVGSITWPVVVFLLLRDTKWFVWAPSMIFLGACHIIIIYFYGFIIGWQTVALAGLASSLTYLLSGVFFCIVSPRFHPLFSPLIFGLCLFIVKSVVFIPFYGAGYLLESPTSAHFLIPTLGTGIVSLLLMSLSIYLCELFRLRRFLLFFTCAGLLVLILFNPFNFSLPEEGTVVALVQGNFVSGYNAEPTGQRRVFEYYMNKSRVAVMNGAKIIVWPEYVLVSGDVKYTHYMNEIANFSRTNDVVMIWGVMNVTSDRNIFDTTDLAFVADPLEGLLPPYIAHTRYAANRTVVHDEYAPGVYSTAHGKVALMLCFEMLDDRVVGQYDALDFDVLIGLSDNIFLANSSVLRTLIWNHERLSSRFGVPLLSAANHGLTGVAWFSKSDYLLAGAEKIFYTHIQEARR